MLSGALFVAVPHAVAQVPASSVQVVTSPNPGASGPNIVSTSTAYPPGHKFNVSITVTNVKGLLLYQLGFYFNATVLQVLPNGILPGSIVAYWESVSTVVPVLGSIDNTHGVVSFYTWGVEGANYNFTGSGSLMIVEFEINPSYSTPYTGTLPGTPVPLVTLSSTDIPTQLILYYADGVSIITPLAADIYSGTIDLTVPPPYGPVASFTYSPAAHITTNTLITFTDTSAPAWNGVAYVPISSWAWFVNNTLVGSSNTLTYTPLLGPGIYNVTLLVDVNPALMPPNIPTTDYITQLIPVTLPAAGPFIDLTSQNWRYIDPITISPVPIGYGQDAACDLFRPGDSAQLYAAVTYGGAPVASQLVSFQVDNNLGNTLALGTSISNMSGIATYTFRIPWPTDVMINNVKNGTETLPEFGTWTAYATWQCGIFMNGTQPSEKTVNDTMPFKVGWGLWITMISVSSTPVPNTYTRGVDSVIVKINVENDYMVTIPASDVIATASLYDNLLVPIDTPAYVSTQIYAPGITPVTFAPIPITVYAFVGTAYAVANLFTGYLPTSLIGTAWCPQVGGWGSDNPNGVGTFIITK